MTITASSMERIRTALFRVATGTGPLFLLACHGKQAALDYAGRESADIGSMFRWMFWITVPVFAVVMAFLASAIVRNFRRREFRDPARETHTEHRLHRALIAWIVAIAIGLV